MKNLFCIAYFLGKEGKPLSDMSKQCELAQKLGVDVGKNYHNDLAAKQFLNAVCSNLKMDTKSDIGNASFISVLADGSTDISVQEQIVVYIRYVNQQGNAITSLADIVAPEHSHALGVLEAIKTALSNRGLNFTNLKQTEPGPSLVCVNFDGAAVMQGRKSGVVGHVMGIIPNIIPIHCVAHKLELAILDSIKNIPFLKRYDETIKGIFILYHASPKRMRGLEKLAEALEIDILRFSDLKKTRWVSSKGRAVIALKNNLAAVVAHLENMAAADNIPEAKAYHGTLVTTQFLKTMFLMLDYLPIVSRASKIFQSRDIMVFEVEEQIEVIMLELIALKSYPGPNMREFISLYDAENKLFGGAIKIKGPTPVIEWKDDCHLTHLVDDTITYIDRRFECFKEPPLKHFEIFDISSWPRDRTLLATYGTEGLTDLLGHFAAVFTTEEREKVQQEFSNLKASLSGKTSKDKKEIFENLLNSKPKRFQHILKLVEIMFCLSPCTAECEQGFSTMKSLKKQCKKQARSRNIAIFNANCFAGS